MNTIGEEFAELSRLNFAWEILRHIPAYIKDYKHNLSVKKQDFCECCSSSQQWGLLKFCEP